ncbi:hypothetical protein THRCLA_00473 [Thraustotheca clavata]|uniref:Uncharacterized protein n=1 Tax=Thraustotheca clavata TaxID=74557 RepID=A0A1W0AB56_9STRA|nr:hypothetical protein THRCLA_00473 [Thraustotheca clavata]
MQDWQSNVDLPMRRMMIQKILLLFHNQQEFLLPEAGTRLPSLVRRLELALYLRAASLDEYLNEYSIQRRVQSLIIALHHQRVLQFSMPCHSLGQAITFQMMRGSKRMKLDNMDCYPLAKHVPQPATTMATLLFNNREDILRNVFSFLNGTEVLLCMAINRFAAHFLPSCVQHLSLSMHHLNVLLKGQRLSQCTELRWLRVQTFALSGLRRKNNEEIIVHLAQVIQTGGLKKLRCLRLPGAFINTQSINACATLCNALSHCPWLEELVLDGNVLGDSGAKDVANLLLRQNCPKLRLLDLRRNYIGEAGIKSIAIALSTTKQKYLQWLHLGSNIADDIAITALAGALSKGHTTQLEILGLEDNFVTLQGIHTLVDAFKSGQCPMLKELCIGDNIAENHLIEEIFALALGADSNESS